MNTDDTFGATNTTAHLAAKRIGAALITQATEFTCDECEMKSKCIFAYDPYNTDGDCLADK